MTIGFDLRALQVGFKAHRARGIGTYVLNLSRRLPAVDPANRYIFFVERGEPLDEGAAGIPTVPVACPRARWAPVGRRTLRHQILFPREIARLGLDLAFFASHLDAPARLGCRRAAFVHDLIPLVLRDLYMPDRASLRFRFALAMEAAAARRADGILVNSHATKMDAVRLLGIPPSRIAVTHLAPAPSFAPPRDRSETRAAIERLGVASPYILYLGGIDPRKNMRFLLRSFARALARGLGPVKLVLAGRIREDEEYPRLTAWIRDSALEERVQVLDWVPPADLASLYAGSSAFLYPSLYEGFGLPPIEAMACGAPVLASNRGALPEVLGDGAWLFDPTDEEGYADAIVALARGGEEAARLRERGMARAALFTWDRTAEKTVEAFHRLLAGEPLAPGEG